ncbi:MAG TPA: carbohydrate kinase family protein [Candidatus Nanoarchaeia archaeon]|nr:carbohydrate kinase family protein [Candidatus Nanoarchaeia archaeon]
MNFDIVCFGSAVIDTFISTKIKEKGQFFNYHLGDKILIDNLKFDIGGGGTNTAVAFSRLGFKTGCICNIGTNEAGHQILHLLAKEKVYLLNKNPKGETGYSVILDSKQSDRTILTYKGGNNDISLSDIPSFSTSWLYLSSLLGKSLKTQISLARALKKKKTKIVFNPSLYLIQNAEIKELLKITDVLILNLEEAKKISEKYFGSQDIESLLKLGPKTIVVTNGEKEIVCFSNKQKQKIIPKKVKAVELTGAGDAFASGFVAGLALNWPIKKCLELGLKESTAVIKHFGAKNNLIKKKLVK